MRLEEHINVLNQYNQIYPCLYCNHENDIEKILTLDMLKTELIAKYKSKNPATVKIRVDKRCLFVPASYMYVTGCQIISIYIYKEVG